MLRILLNCLLFPLCLFALAQCGLEYVPYLTPPRSLSKTPTAFKVRKLEANDNEFVVGEWEYLGIELYYKFYLPSAALQTNYTKLSELEANGFYRVSRFTPPGDDQQTDKAAAVRKPVLRIDTGLVEFQNDVDFRIDLANFEIIEEGTSTVMVEQIRRGVPYNPDTETDKYPNFQQFVSDDFDASDGDVGSDLYDYISSTPGGSIIMVMYALSYGKIDGLIDLFSDAVYVGDNNVYFGW